MVRTVLTIAGFDPSSGAGVTADLAVMAAHGLFGTSCITALTVQSTLAVRATYPVDARVLTETLEYLMADLPACGIKIGMLGTDEIVAAVVEFLHGYGRRGPVVLDPVVRSSSGRGLLEKGGVRRMAAELLPLVDWVTPNLEELGVLAEMSVATREEMVAAALRLRTRFAGLNVVGTGGHLKVPDDLLVGQDDQVSWLPGVRVESQATHGTGCAFSTALLCGLIRGRTGFEAVRAAKDFVVEGIRRGPGLGGGKGPLELLWPLGSENAGGEGALSEKAGGRP